jgi:hypothetical protein
VRRFDEIRLLRSVGLIACSSGAEPTWMVQSTAIAVDELTPVGVSPQNPRANTLSLANVPTLQGAKSWKPRAQRVWPMWGKLYRNNHFGKYFNAKN